jgi:hypothetical protein
VRRAAKRSQTKLSVASKCPRRQSDTEASIPHFLAKLFHGSVAPLRSSPGLSGNRTCSYRYSPHVPRIRLVSDQFDDQVKHDDAARNWNEQNNALGFVHFTEEPIDRRGRGKNCSRRPKNERWLQYVKESFTANTQYSSDKACNGSENANLPNEKSSSIRDVSDERNCKYVESEQRVGRTRSGIPKYENNSPAR